MYSKAADGSIVYEGSRRLVIGSNECLGILVDTGERMLEGMATLLRHGSGELVAQTHKRQWAELMAGAAGRRNEDVAKIDRMISAVVFDKLPPAFNGNPKPDVKELMQGMAADLRLYLVAAADATPEFLEEINACIDTAGRVRHLGRRMEEWGIPNRAATPSPLGEMLAEGGRPTTALTLVQP